MLTRKLRGQLLGMWHDDWLTYISSIRYKAMEECQKKGKTKAIGVSNFSQAEMERLVKESNIVRYPCSRFERVDDH